MQHGPLKDATIVFDLDGTLVDTAPDLTNALNHVLTRRGHVPVPAASIRSSVAFGARAMIEEGLRRSQASDDVDQMLAEFLAHYEANIAAESVPFPGAVRALESLAAAGAKLALCTNKREDLTLKLLEALRLDDHFDAIAGRNTFAVAKPHPDHLTGVIARAGGNPAKAVMVGDSEVDMATAKAARVKTILVSFGYAGAPLAALSPDGVIDHFDELVPRATGLLRDASG